MRRIFAYYCRQSPDPGTLGSRRYKEGRESMKRLLAVSLIGAELLTHSPTDAMAQMSEATKHIIWLSCANKIEGKDVNHIFAIDIKQQKVLQFENRNIGHGERALPESALYLRSAKPLGVLQRADLRRTAGRLRHRV